MLNASPRVEGGQEKAHEADVSRLHQKGAGCSAQRGRRGRWSCCLPLPKISPAAEVLFCLFALSFNPVFALTKEELSILQRERADAALKWAPLVWLHPQERFFPAPVHNFLKHVVPMTVPENERIPEPPVVVSMSRSLNTLVTLPEGPNSKDTYLMAPIDPECRNCPLPRFLHGSKPRKSYMPAVYAVITSCLPTQKPDRPTNFFKHRFSSRGFRKFKKNKGFMCNTRSSRAMKSPKGAQIKPCGPTDLDQNKYKNALHKLKLRKPLKQEQRSPDPIRYNILDTQESYSRELDPNSDDSFTISTPSSALQESTIDPSINQSHVDESLLSLDLMTQVESSEAASHLFESPYQDEITTSSYVTVHDLAPTFSPSGENVPSEEWIESHEIKNDQKNTTKWKYNKTRLKGHKFTITYWMFYPFSQGKRVCTRRMWLLGRIFKPRIRSKCYGEVVTLNSHVGDWEHISMFFEDGSPERMYVSTHTYGAYYKYHREKRLFVYQGKDTRLGLPLNPKFSPVVKMEGTHPVLYAALGSHGLWASPGPHRYEKLIPLEDKTAPGTRWETWENVDIIDYRNPNLGRPDRQWMNFNGRWGNPSHGCHRALFGSCDLASGPTGIPLKRVNFPCYLPQHPTFYPKV